FTVGDPSGSHSERWKMNIHADGPDDTRQFGFVSPDFGQMGTQTFLLRRGNSYTITLSHVATNRNNGPDYDWEAQVDNLPITTVLAGGNSHSGPDRFKTIQNAWLLDNGDGLLGIVNQSFRSTNHTTGKSARLIATPELNKIISKQRLQFEKYYLPGGSGKHKVINIPEFLLVGPTAIIEPLGGEVFAFEVNLISQKEDLIILDEILLFGLVKTEVDPNAPSRPIQPVNIDQIATANHAHIIDSEEGLYHVEIVDRPDTEGMGFSFFVMGYDINGNGVLDIDEVDISKLFPIRFVDKQEYLNTSDLTILLGTGASILQFHLAASHLDFFHGISTTLGVWNGAVFNTLLEGDDPRLEHRVGAVWNETSAMAPHILYPENSAVNNKIRGNVMFIDAIREYKTDNQDILLQAAQAAEGNVDVAFEINDHVIVFDGDQDAYYQDVYNAFGKAELNGEVTFTIEFEDDELKINKVFVDAVLTDLYDWDYVFWMNATALTFDHHLAKVQAGYPTLGNNGRVFQITATVIGEVDL
ncbi:MAG: hypothetical protein LAT79_16655, partial [Kiritimatiellae bacterium]|nr:hypothetical protein [Kiritimatiellia bacterium]